MPARDGTGPFGNGPQGFGKGGCKQPESENANTPMMAGRGGGKGQGQGGGRGCCGRRGGRQGFGSQNAAPLSREDEATLLENQIKLMQERLSGLQQQKA